MALPIYSDRAVLAEMAHVWGASAHDFSPRRLSSVAWLPPSPEAQRAALAAMARHLWTWNGHFDLGTWSNCAIGVCSELPELRAIDLHWANLARIPDPKKLICSKLGISSAQAKAVFFARGYWDVILAEANRLQLPMIMDIRLYGTQTPARVEDLALCRRAITPQMVAAKIQHMLNGLEGPPEAPARAAERTLAGAI